MRLRFTRGWLWGGGAYLTAVLLLAAYALAGDHYGAYLTLLGVTGPSSLVLLVPIYLTTSLVDGVLGHGLNGSPASLTVAVAGFVLAAAINVLLLRLATLGLGQAVRSKRARSARAT